MRPDRSIWHRREVETTGSTNVDLLREAEAGHLAHRTVLRSNHQTAGRGRLDRQWDAPPGANLLASMYLDTPSERAVELMHRVGLAIVAAATEWAPISTIGVPAEEHEIGLKWPNDVLVDGQKLAGVLAQRSTSASGIVVGFGVNVGWAPPGAARLHDVVGEDLTPDDVLDRVLAAFDAQPDDISARYRQSLVTIGKRVRVILPGASEVVGLAVDVDVDGRLIVQTDAGENRTFDVGDVVHLRLAD